MKRWLLLLLILFLPLGALAESPALTIACPGKVTGFQENVLTIHSDRAETLTLRLEQRGNVWRAMTVSVQAGENVLAWDGLGENEERLPEGKLDLIALTADGREVWRGEITVGRSENAVLYALPSSDVLYLESDWFAEVCAVRQGALMVEIYQGERLLATQRESVKSGEPFKLRWKGKAGRETVPEGTYRLRYYMEKNPAWVREIMVEVRAGATPTLPVTVTGPVLPADGDDDAAIWQIMQKPSVVADVAAVSHQKVYAGPSKSTDVLGTFHGQSQGMEVFDIRDDGWARVGGWNHETGDYVEGYVPLSSLKVVAPNGEYGLLVDKRTQRMAVFYRGERIAEMAVSTGLVAKNKMIRETAAGAFLTLEHMEPFSMDGKKYEHVIRYDGGNLLHQLPYRWVSGRKDYTEGQSQLGQKASHGCVRMDRLPGESGVTAYWLWTHLPWGTRVIILDDPAQRMEQAAAVAAGRLPVSQIRSEPAAPPLMLPEESELRLTVGGDAVIGTREAWWDKTESLPSYLARSGMDYPFSGLYKVFAEDDMTFINLECVLKEDSKGEKKDKLYRFRGLPSYTAVLTEGSVEQVSIANNHHIDYGSAGRDATRKALEDAGIPYSGYGYTWVWEKDGHRVGFGGCRETVYRQNKGIIAQDAASLRAQGCDVIIYTCHWGKEYSPGHNELQLEMARAAAAAGVDIVVGAHPHVVQGVDTVDGTLVLWSLGNLMFGGTHDMTTFDAALARIDLRFGAEGYQGCTVRMLPILTSTSADIGLNDFRPVLARDADYERIWQKIQADSGLLLTEAMWFPAR